MTAKQNIWYPGGIEEYEGQEGVYAKKIGDLLVNDTIAVVQKRAQEDGEWAIENELLDESEEMVRKMIAWVSDENNIWQCLVRLGKQKLTMERTVDFVCRELAEGTLFILRGPVEGNI